MLSHKLQLLAIDDNDIFNNRISSSLHLKCSNILLPIKTVRHHLNLRSEKLKEISLWSLQTWNETSGDQLW